MGDVPTGTGKARLQDMFATARSEERAVLLPYLTAGIPSIDDSVELFAAMADAGADALELNLYRISVDRNKNAVEIEDEDLELISAVRAAVAIPLSVGVTFAPLYISGVSLNVMSLGGLALGVGLLVDNSVVVAENIHRLHREGELGPFCS